MSFSNNTIDKLEKAQDSYYEKNTRHVFFKNKQKLDCANYISNNMNLEELIQSTIVILPNTNKIYYNYLLFKLYANEKCFELLYIHMIKLIQTILMNYPTFEFHINLQTFSISACQRYYQLITNTLSSNQLYFDKMDKIVIYHTPNIIDSITRLLYNYVKDMLDKVEYVKEDSETRIKILFDIQ
jgi:hypothetical protein